MFIRVLVLLITFSLCVGTSAHAQDRLAKIVASIETIEILPLHADVMYSEIVPEGEPVPEPPKYCGDSLFWEAVAARDTIIPYLFDKLTDTTPTQVIVVYFGHYTVADVSYEIMKQMINGLPDVEIMGVMKDNGLGEQNKWNYLRKSIRNRNKFKRALHHWYQRHKSMLNWVSDDSPAGGHYEIGHRGKKTCPVK